MKYPALIKYKQSIRAVPERNVGWITWLEAYLDLGEMGADIIQFAEGGGGSHLFNLGVKLVYILF